MPRTRRRATGQRDLVELDIMEMKATRVKAFSKACVSATRVVGQVRMVTTSRRDRHARCERAFITILGSGPRLAPPGASAFVSDLSRPPGTCTTTSIRPDHFPMVSFDVSTCSSSREDSPKSEDISPGQSLTLWSVQVDISEGAIHHST